MEIERKFLVSSPPESIGRHAGVRIEQGYLAIAEEVEVRLRRAGSTTRLTVKGGRGDVRDEFEIGVDPQVFEAIWPLTEGRRLQKTRRRMPLKDGLIAEVDYFEGALEGLVVAEVEFESEAAEHEFDPPGWLGEELTGDHRYAGQSLATEGSPRLDRVGDRRYRLKRKESVAAGSRRIARGRVEKALERLTESGGDDAAVHGVRKDLKKLRAALRLVRDGLDEDFYRAQNRRYREAGRLLSDARDAQVKLDTLAALDECYGSEVPERSAAAWRRELENEREEVVEGSDGESRARLQEAKEALSAGAEDLAEWPIEGHGWSLIESGLSRGYRDARKAMKRARSSRSAEDVHDWRKRTKDLWYHLRLLRGIWKPVIGELAEQAHALGDLLGDHHDLTVLAADLESRDGIEERERLGELIERRQEELLKKALKLGSRLFAEKPKAFRRRFRLYWRAWR